MTDHAFVLQSRSAEGAKRAELQESELNATEVLRLLPSAESEMLHMVPGVFQLNRVGGYLCNCALLQWSCRTRSRCGTHHRLACPVAGGMPNNIRSLLS